MVQVIKSHHDRIYGVPIKSFGQEADVGAAPSIPLEKEQVLWLKKNGGEPAIEHYCIGQSRKPTLGLVFVLFVGRLEKGLGLLVEK
jgi:hypothetical protein